MGCIGCLLVLSSGVTGRLLCRRGCFIVIKSASNDQSCTLWRKFGLCISVSLGVYASSLLWDIFSIIFLDRQCRPISELCILLCCLGLK